MTGTCDPATLTRPLTQTRSRTVTTPAANGGTCTDSLYLAQTITEACVITEPIPPVDKYLVGPIASCTRPVAVQPPDAAGGWIAQFQRLSGTSWLTFGTADATAPYSRTFTFAAGNTSLRAVWTKTGVTSVIYPIVVVTCP
jgi:hypothetical protein